MMLDNPIIDVAIGLVFFYVTLSLVCSSIQEIIASLLGLRSRNLKKGIENLIGNEYAQMMYEHPLIKGMRKPNKLPSYIKPELFSTVLIDMISRDKTDENAIDTAVNDVRDLIAKIDPNNPTRETADQPGGQRPILRSKTSESGWPSGSTRGWTESRAGTSAKSSTS